MHTWQSNVDHDRQTIIHHNGDHSGDAKIRLLATVEELDSGYNDEVGPYVYVEIPNKILRDYVLDWLMIERIGRMESQDYDDMWKEAIG